MKDHCFLVRKVISLEDRQNQQGVSNAVASIFSQEDCLGIKNAFLLLIKHLEIDLCLIFYLQILHYDFHCKSHKLLTQRDAETKLITLVSS